MERVLYENPLSQLMIGAIYRGLNVLIDEGPIPFFCKTKHFVWSRYLYPVISSMVNTANESYVLGVILTPILSALLGRIIFRKKQCYIRYTFRPNCFGKRKYYFPSFEYYNQIDKVDHLENKYFSHIEVCIEDGEKMMEVGAFVGVTTAIAANVATHVIALEASPRNYFCAKQNLSGLNVELQNYAAWNENTELEINYGVVANDDSLMSPDHGHAGFSEKVRAVTIETLCEELELDSVDILKIEAEGVEPEIVEAIGSVNIDKVIVNCTEERDKKSPVKEVAEILRESEFTIIEVTKKQILFARKSTNS